MSEKREDGVRPGLAATLVDRPIGLLVVFVTLIVIGLIAYALIPLQLLPKGIQGSALTVWVNHPGSSAAENAPCQSSMRARASAWVMLR